MTIANEYFKRVKEQVIFTGETMTIDIPKRYENLGWLRWGNTMEVVGIFKIVINGSIEIGYNLQAFMSTRPSDTEKVNIDNKPYVRLIYKKGDVFRVNEDIVQQGSIPYVVLNEFIALGNLPAWMNYKNAYKLFENTSKLTGVSFSTDKVYFHIMLAHLFRAKDNIMELYRNSKKNKPPTFVGMLDTAHSALTTMAKTIGSYASKGLESSIVNHTEEVSDLENLMRD